MFGQVAHFQQPAAKTSLGGVEISRTWGAAVLRPYIWRRLLATSRASAKQSALFVLFAEFDMSGHFAAPVN
jgi:hypothetical protein